MSTELLHIMFKSIAEGKTDKASEALSQYLNAMGKHIHSLNEGVKNHQRFRIKDQHRHEYPEHLHTVLKAHTQPYRKPSESGSHMQVSPVRVDGVEVGAKDLQHHVEVPIHHLENLKESTVDYEDDGPVSYTAPSSWASYLINGDDSGLDPHEKATADEWIDSVGLGMPVSCEDAGFIKRPDSFNVYHFAADCQTYFFHSRINP